ncbi:hypothetical protein [Streptomyces sulphureus]|nr:hypothetical protein [Streptomyces sulphureus]
MSRGAHAGRRRCAASAGPLLLSTRTGGIVFALYAAGLTRPGG